MAAILKSQIFTAGTKFVVAENSVDGTFGPGTTGYLSYVKGRDQDYKNVVYYRFITIQRGKGGKERLEVNELSTPVFEIEHENMAKLLPDAKRRYFVHIDPVLPAYNSIFEMPEIDFLAWSLAYAKLIRKLNTRAKHVNAWPGDPADPLNGFIRLDEYYGEDPGFAKSEYANPTARKRFIGRIRIMESTLMKCSLSYMTKVAEIEQAAIHEIIKSGIKLEDSNVLTKTYEVFSNKVSSLQLLSTKAPNEIKAKAAASKGLSWLK